MKFVWEPYTTTLISLLPPICVIGSVAWCAVVPLICFQVIDWHQPDRVLRQFGMQQSIPGCPSQPLNIHGITLKGKHDENWGQLFGPMINQWNNRVDFRVDGYPRQEGLLSFNSDYMVWYRRKMKMFVDPKNANTTTLVFFAFLERLIKTKILPEFLWGKTLKIVSFSLETFYS